jgi:8-oxo-dGTP pyrophosphatase MutT (NUDIX family)
MEPEGKEEAMVEVLRRQLAERVGMRQDRPGLVRSAVLVPILVGADGISVLYTKRSEALNHHRGQISFPGGKWSPEDPTLLDTALREADEEVGLDPGAVEVLGELDEVWTPTGFTIRPYAGLIRAPYPFRVNPAEIDRLIEVPWASIPAAEAFGCEVKMVNGEPLEICHFHVANDLIWGATARITRNLMSLLSQVKEELAG